MLGARSFCKLKSCKTTGIRVYLRTFAPLETDISFERVIEIDHHHINASPFCAAFVGA
jgi:hypothetical protein